MKISDFFKELRSRNWLLYWTGWIHFVLLVLFIIAYFVDDTTILGINAWIKPIKFAISIAIYTWTFGWILHYIPNSRAFIKLMSWAIGLSMFAEMIVIALQSFRGVKSHFNFDTAFDGIAFGVMGIMIITNTVAIVLTILWIYIKKPDLPGPYLLSIRLGFIIFLVANLIGGMMIGNGAHSIGGLDGGEGLPFVNWSKEFGDLRVAHFFGLHSIQIIPLIAFFMETKTSLKVKTQYNLVWLCVILFAVLFGWVWYQAIAGNPLL